MILHQILFVVLPGKTFSSSRFTTSNATSSLALQYAALGIQHKCRWCVQIFLAMTRIAQRKSQREDYSTFPPCWLNLSNPDLMRLMNFNNSLWSMYIVHFACTRLRNLHSIIHLPEGENKFKHHTQKLLALVCVWAYISVYADTS